MQFLSYIVQHFYNIDYEAFTKKFLAAIQVLEALKKQAEINKEGEGKQTLVKQEDIDMINWIGQNTNINVMVSIPELDRCIGPNKGSFDMNDNKRRFRRNDWKLRENAGKNVEVTLTELQMQYYLVMAIKDISIILVKNVMWYNEEYPMEFDTEDKFNMKDYLGGKQDGKTKEKRT